MNSYTQAAMEQAMKVQEVMLQAMAKKVSWSLTAEILGISDRHLGAGRSVTRSSDSAGCSTTRRRQAFAQARGSSDRGAIGAAVPRALFRSECAALSPKLGAEQQDRLQLRLR